MEGCLEEIRSKSAELAALHAVPRQLTSMQDMLRTLIAASQQLSAEVLALNAHSLSPPQTPEHRRPRKLANLRQPPSPSFLANRCRGRKAPLDPKKFQSAPAAEDKLSSCNGEEAPLAPVTPKIRHQRSWGDGLQASRKTVEDPPGLFSQSDALPPRPPLRSTSPESKHSQQSNLTVPLGRNGDGLAKEQKKGKAQQAVLGLSKVWQSSVISGIANTNEEEEMPKTPKTPKLRPRRASWCLNEKAKLSHVQALAGFDRTIANQMVLGKQISKDAEGGTGPDEIGMSSAPVASPAGKNQKAERRYMEHEGAISPCSSEGTVGVASQGTLGVASQESGLSLGLVNKHGSALFQTAATVQMEVKDFVWVLRPNSQLRLAWDVLIILNSVCIGIVIPLGIVYFDSSCGSDAICLSDGMSAILFYFTDLLWLLDIILNFRTGFFTHGEVEMNSWLIAMHYMRRWLVFDLLAAFPLALASMNPTLHIVVCALKLLRLLQIIPRVARLQAEYRFCGLLPTKIFIVYILLAHITACGWRLVQDEQRLAGSAAPWWDFYVADLYWVIMTFTTIGYGDIVPKSTRAQLYAIAVMCMGSASFGGVVSACTHITSKVFNDEIESQVADVMRFMARRSVPKDLQRRVQSNLRHHLHSQRLTSIDSELLGMLSPTMQRELSLSLLGSTVLRFPLFQNTQRSFLAELAQVHCWVQCVAGDVVLEEGEILQNLIFVIRGRLMSRSSPGADSKRLDVSISEALKLTLENNEDDSQAIEATPRADADWMYDSEPKEKNILAGAWFGEACLMDQERICACTIVAVTDAELAVLAADDYLRVVRKYPKLWEKHRSIQWSLASGSLSIDKLAYKEPQQRSKELNMETAWFWRLFRLPRIANLKAVVPAHDN